MKGEHPRLRRRLWTTCSRPERCGAGRALAERRPDSVLARWLAKGEVERGALAGAAAAVLRRAVDSGMDDPSNPDAAAIALLRRRSEALAPYVAQLITLYAPEVFVVTGSFARDPALFQLKLLRAAVRAFAPALEEYLPPFAPSAFGLRRSARTQR